MARIIDEPQENEETAIEEETGSVEELSQESQETVEETTQTEPEIPEKYQGKSIQDVVQMHQEAEKALGRQGGEVGELRKIVDDFILSQSTTVEQAQEQVTEVDFFENPKDAVNQAVQNHPAIKAAERAANDFTKQTAQAQIMQKHPDAETIIQDADFNKWVQSSPVKQEMARKAAVEHNFELVDELLTDWKDRQTLVRQTLETEETARKQTVSKASTGSAKGSTEKPSKKIYRRADIIKLQMTDPDRYEAMQPDIIKAYSEGRVK